MCKDIGIDCPFEALEQLVKLMRKFIDHAEPAHKIEIFPIKQIFEALKK
jgi:predicted small metal-binding protein